MASASQFLEKYGNQPLTCTPYVLSKLGVDRNKCFLKIEEYSIICIPVQFGFKRSLFLATLAQQEFVFFNKYINTLISLSISFAPAGRAPAKFHLLSTLVALEPMKGRERVGVFTIDFKSISEELINLLGGFQETQERLQRQYEEHGTLLIRMTLPVAKQLGYTAESIISEAGKETKKIQILSLTTKSIEHMEPLGSPLRIPGTPVAYEIILKNTRLLLTGIVANADTLPQGMVRTVSNLSFSPELVEIIADYWYTIRNPVKIAK
ncbi:hypothetical protein TREPR_2695 [Treponema primitia ZAS-2]|uniref:Uncharacterized protein n=1 Tax=Treponema primitia (strain ATCC BAA-887 / DSM 12427 / ZAS-2) TaxID=545694 RepID=F5YQN9_TREPZ|nr:hypothetical protein [Treponema primitia]AEF84893.1 hypothetical protein TREPR_2695 [Treponema primitia ZAS-2]